jgi:hypothetical protein
LPWLPEAKSSVYRDSELLECGYGFESDAKSRYDTHSASYEEPFCTRAECPKSRTPDIDNERHARRPNHATG